MGLHTEMMCSPVSGSLPTKDFIPRVLIASAISEVAGDKFTLKFPEKVRAVTPGQAVVLYQGEFVAGGGTIMY